MKGIIYCATSPSGKKYYGRTIKTLQRRKVEHNHQTNKGSDLYFHNAIRKYGIENFEWKEIEKIDENDKLELIDILNELEIFYIDKDHTLFPGGYNLTKGGGNYNIHPLSRKGKSYEEIFGTEKAAEIKAKQKKNMIGKNTVPQSKEAIAKRVLANTGKKRTEETKEKTRQTMLGVKHTAERNKNISESLKGKMLANKNPAYVHIPEDIQSQIIDLHINQRWGSRKLEKKFGYTYSKILRFLKDKGVYKNNKIW